MLKISPDVKLPLNLSKGSYPGRIEKAQKLTDKFFDKISGAFTEKDISPDVFVKNIEEVLPSKVNYKFESSNGKDLEGSVILCTTEQKPSEISLYKILFPTNPYDGKISIYKTDSFMHEMFHFFCAMCNPKHIAKTAELAESSFRYYDDFFYNEYLYNKHCNDLNNLKEVLLPDILNNMPISEKVLFLQNCRYKLLEEVKAWENGHKYGVKNQELHKDLIPEVVYVNDGSEFQLKEKLQIVTEALKTVFKEARNSE